MNVRPRLHAGADNAETLRRRLEVQRRQRRESRRRYGRGPHLRDQAAIHHRQRLAGGAIEQLDHRHVRSEYRASALPGKKVTVFTPITSP